jgi:hypothetical protein
MQHGADQDRRQEHQRDIGDAEELVQSHGHRDRQTHQQRGDGIGQRVECGPWFDCRGWPRGWRQGWRQCRGAFGRDLDHVDVDAAGAVDQALGDRPGQHLAPGWAGRFADDQMGDVVGAGIVDHRNRHVLARDQHRFGAQKLGQPQGLRHAVLFGGGGAPRTGGLDADRGPGGAKLVGQALGVADGGGGLGAGLDAHHDALSGRPGAVDGMAAHVVNHLVVHALCGAPQRQFAQRRQVAGGEVVPHRAFGLRRHIDLAVLQTLDQVLRGQVDQFDVVGAFDHPVGDGLADADAGDLGQHVVQAFDVLDIQCGIDVDPGGQQFLDVEVALGMAAGGRVAVCQFIDQHQAGTAGQDGVKVHLGQGAAAIGDGAAGDGFQAGGQRLGFRPAMGFDHPDDHIDLLAPPGPGGGEHFIGLADARGGAEEDLQTAALRLLRLLEESVR